MKDVKRLRKIGKGKEKRETALTLSFYKLHNMNVPHSPPKFDDIIPYFYVALEETRRLVILSQHDEDEEKKEKVSSEKDENDKEAPATKPKITRNADKLAQNLGHVHIIFQDLQKAAFDHRQQKKQPNDSNANEINNNNDNVHDAIIQDCLNKLTKLSCAVLTHVTGGMKLSFHEDLTNNINKSVDNNKNSVVVVPDEDQAAVAHIVELVILFHVISNSFNHSHENRNTYEERIYEIIELYSSYQRKVLRQRSKPYIAYLVQLRQTPGYFLTQHHHQLKRNNNDEDDDDEEGEIDPELERQQNQPHTYTITFILGQASQLLQPLGAWIDSLPFDFEHLVSLLRKFDSSSLQEKKEGGMMIGMPFYLLYLSYSTMKILHEEAQKLTSTILTWLDEDRKISSDWIDKSILHYRRQQQQSVSAESSLQGVNVSGLEDICNELSFLCQVLARYMQFTSSLLPDFSSPPVIVNKAETTTSSCFDFSTISCHLSQYCGNYASLEEFYASVSLLKAITIASAVPILTGEKVFVPSIVEDSFYISQRALERAHETMSSQAIITVIHRIVEMWECKTEEEILQEQYNKEQQHSQQQNTAVAIGVYKALMSNGGLLLDVCEAEMEADTGRTKKEEEMILQQQQQQKQQEKAKQALNSENDGDFTNAFLDAIDQDIGPSASKNNNNNINDTSTDENSSTIALSSLSLSTLTKAPTSLLHSTFSMLSSTSVSSSNHSSTNNNNNNLNSSSHFAQIMNTGKNNNNRKQKLDSGLQGLFSQICLLNGISSASSACAALSSFMDTFLSTTTHNENGYYDDDDEQNPQKGDNDTPEKKLFQLSQENLKSYSFNFSRLLSNMTTQMVTEWCGKSTEFASHIVLLNSTLKLDWWF